jgi:hypothetical protein
MNGAVRAIEVTQSDNVNLCVRQYRRIGHALVLLVVLLLMPAAARAADPPPAFPEEPKSGAWTMEHGLMAGAFILHGIDLSGSMFRFGKDPGRYYEANPLFRPLQDRPEAFAVAKMAFATAINGYLLTHQKTKPHFVRYALIAENAAMLYVVIHNERQP